MGVAKDRVLHTAESLHHDHVPAKRFGLATAWIHRRAAKGGFGATRAPDQPVKPDWEVPSMAALVDLHRRETGDRR
jgi:2-haloacid dehalogenase